MRGHAEFNLGFLAEASSLGVFADAPRLEEEMSYASSCCARISRS
jgi:hypothetical protein